MKNENNSIADNFVFIKLLPTNFTKTQDLNIMWGYRLLYENSKEERILLSKALL